jgi:hypothetical protein
LRSFVFSFGGCHDGRDAGIDPPVKLTGFKVGGNLIADD